MPQKILNDADIDALLQQMRGKAMAKRVHSHGLSKAGCIGRLPTSALNSAAGHWRLVILTREEAGDGWLGALEVIAQDYQQLRGQHDVAILAAFGLTNMDHHALAVDIGGRELHDLGDA